MDRVLVLTENGGVCTDGVNPWGVRRQVAVDLIANVCGCGRIACEHRNLVKLALAQRESAKRQEVAG